MTTKPLVTGTTHTLPFEKLSPDDFERLCLWLVECEGYTDAKHLGAAGGEQGRDITAWREGALWAFQCKRVQSFGPKSALAEIEKVLGLQEAERPAGLVFLVTRNVSADTRKQARARCAQAGIMCDFWAGTELDAKVKQHSEILKEFFQVASSMGGDTVHSDKIEGDKIIGDKIIINVHYYPIKLRAPLREAFDPLLEDHTALFGGREAVLTQLADFIQGSKGGYLVVTAPAGFGKTALMANLVSGTPEAFAYHFFTPLYGADSLTEDFFLRNVVEQMAQWHGHTGLLPDKLHELRALYHQFLGEPLERTRVLVIDGLDEVSTWKLTPYLSRRLPTRLHIILTVRDVGQDWAVEYGLPTDQTEHLVLGGLTRDEVAQVLRVAGQGAVVFAENPALLDEVMRVSTYQADELLGADPFFVRLLAEDAAAERLTPENISAQPQGLDAYLDRQWREVKRLAGDEPARDLFGTLTVALGPISRAELETINPSLLDDWAEDFFHEVLSRVRRWVVGDGARGYVLAPPRLCRYMRTRIRTDPYHDKLLDFCAKWREHHSPYALAHYGEHLGEAGQIDDLYALVESQDWTSVKYVNTPWADSLVQDLQLASRIAAGGNVEDWVRSIGYQLRRAVIEEQMTRMFYRAIIFLAKLGHVGQALDFARRHWRRFDLTREIAQIISSTQPTNALDIWIELAHLADDRSSLDQCKARLAVAQEILRRIPSFSNIAQDLIREARSLEHTIPESHLSQYKAEWALPTLALSENLEVAIEQAGGLPLLQQAQALRHISLALPQGHPARQSLLEQALSVLECIEQSPEAVNEKMKTIVILLPFVDNDRQNELLDALVSTGDYLQSIKRPFDYNWTQYWAIGRVAQVSLDWARHMLFESEWRGALDAWPKVIEEIARVDHGEALQLLQDRFSNWAIVPQVLTDVVRIVALKDTDNAQALVEEYTKQLRDDRREAYLAVAEGYLAQGNTQKAQEIFDKHVFVIDEEGLVHAKEDLQLAILNQASSFLSVEVARDRLMQFPVCPRCHRSKEQEAKRILARMAACQGRIDFLEEHHFSLQAQLAAAYDLADYVSPKAAREYLERRHITPGMKGSEEVYAHIAAVEAQQDPTKLEILVQHFNDNSRSHHFCDYRVAFPEALCTLVRTNRIESAEARALIERVYSLLVDYQCPQGDKSVPHRLFGGRCACYNDRDQVLAHLVGIMAQLDLSRSEQMVDSLPAQPIRVYALQQILHHTQASETRVRRIIAAGEESIKDPWQRAILYYDLAILLPTEMASLARHLIETAEPLLDKVRSNRTNLKIHKAQALVKLVSNVCQFANLAEGLKTIEELALLDHKLRILYIVVQQAMEWSKDDRLALLWYIWEKATTQRLMDVQAFIAFSIPLVNSLAGEASFWRLYDYVEWTYQGLPQADQREAKTG